MVVCVLEIVSTFFFKNMLVFLCTLYDNVLFGGPKLMLVLLSNFTLYHNLF